MRRQAVLSAGKDLTEFGNSRIYAACQGAYQDLTNEMLVEAFLKGDSCTKKIVTRCTSYLGQALGGKTFKLKFGHRGGNQPVKDLESGRVEITSQNHGFAVDPKSLPLEVNVDRINLNDQTVEGMRHKRKPIFCVQYHPEASPGPHDSTLLFAEFRAMIEKA